MNLPKPGQQYDPENEAVMRAAVEAELRAKTTQATIYDKIFIRDTVTGIPHIITLVSGTLTVT